MKMNNDKMVKWLEFKVHKVNDLNLKVSPNVSLLDVSFAFGFQLFKLFFGEHSTLYSQAWILEPRHLPKEAKKVKFPHNTMKGGRLTISLTRMLCFWVKI
jgi:hypothetical protein